WWCYDDDDDGGVGVVMMTTVVVWWWVRAVGDDEGDDGDSGVAVAVAVSGGEGVEARDMGDWVGWVMGTIFGLGRKSRQKRFSAAASGGGAGRRWLSEMVGEREEHGDVCVLLFCI
ncbi:hypothetical protein Tco_1530093, partial [Tanacetum coccineum]